MMPMADRNRGAAAAVHRPMRDRQCIAHVKQHREE
jgi:hypothetical protein